MTDQGERPDHLYVIGEGNGNGIVKIGHSYSPAARLGGIQTGNPKKVQLLLVVPEAGQHEDALHRRFSSHRLGGEWFDLGTDDPVGRVQHALDEILRADETLPASPELPAVPYIAPSEAKAARPPLPASPPRRNACEEAGCGFTAIGPIVNAAARWFLDNHPDPGAYLLEQGFAWHCIEETLGIKLPEAEAALYEVPSPYRTGVPGIRTLLTCGFTVTQRRPGSGRLTDGGRGCELQLQARLGVRPELGLARSYIKGA